MSDDQPPPRDRERGRDRSPPRRSRSRSRSRSPRRGGGGSGKSKGTAARWNERGFGFIKPDDGSEVCWHGSCVCRPVAPVRCFAGVLPWVCVRVLPARRRRLSSFQVFFAGRPGHTHCVHGVVLWVGCGSYGVALADPSKGQKRQSQKHFFVWSVLTQKTFPAHPSHLFLCCCGVCRTSSATSPQLPTVTACVKVTPWNTRRPTMNAAATTARPT